MPREVKDAIQWAVEQYNEEGIKVSKDDSQDLVDLVREFFNKNEIDYDTFSYIELIPYL